MPHHVIALALKLIPTHRQNAKTVAALVDELALDGAASVIEATLMLLTTFGALQQHEISVRSKDQRTTYFIESLRLWLEQANQASEANEADESQTLITPELVRAMESQRMKQAEATGSSAQPTRIQAAAFVLIGRVMNGEICLLCQWDRQARQYQLIGGRLEPGETATQAAHREFLEEVGAAQIPPLQADVDFELRALLDEPITLNTLSPTYGALTSYAFHLFQARMTNRQLVLGPEDVWIAVRDLLRGRTVDGKQIGDPRVYHEIDRRLVSGLAGLATSF